MIAVVVAVLATLALSSAAVAPAARAGASSSSTPAPPRARPRSCSPLPGRPARSLAAAGKADVDYFRAPDGNLTPSLVRMAARDGMQPLGWTVDPRDWSRPGTEAIVRIVEAQVRPGAVILFHDGGGPRDQTVQAVTQLIPWLRAHGYSFVLPS